MKNNAALIAEIRAKRDFFAVDVRDQHLLDFGDIFGNNNPVYVEIGCGKGEFVSSYSLLNPEHNFIGFEVRQKRVNLILRKLNLDIHKNVRLATLFIDSGVEQIIPSNSVDGVFIQHPDPWPKRKHFRRRLIQQSFIDAISKIIKQDGFIQISTDHTDYAEWIWKEFLKRKDFTPKNIDSISDKPLLDKHIETFYEIEQRRLGFEPKHMMFIKL